MDFLLFVFSRLAAAILLPQQQSPEDESKPPPIVGFKGKCSIKSVVLWQWRHYARNRKRSDEKIKTQKKTFLCFCPPKSKKEIDCYSKWGAIDEKILKKYFRTQNTWSSIRILRKVYIFRMYILKVFRQHCLSIPSWKSENLSSRICATRARMREEPPSQTWKYLKFSCYICDICDKIYHP